MKLGMLSAAGALGALLAAAPVFLLTRAVYQRAELAAKAELATVRAELAATRASELVANEKLNALLLEDRDAQHQELDRIAGGLDAVAQRVRVCASKSDVRVSLAPTGAIETAPSGQFRDLAEALGEFARACAVGRDRDAIDHNALVDWIEETARRAAAANGEGR